MGYIDNKRTIDEINDAIRGNAASNPAPQALGSVVTPVINVNPKAYQKSTHNYAAIGLNAAQTVILTTNLTQDFYITGICLSMIKDATSQSTATDVIIKTTAGTFAIVTITGLTLTAQNDSKHVSFSFPIKVERGSAIYINNSSVAAGNIRASGSVQGFYGDIGSNAQ